jgi:hypothetical protein
MNKDWIAFAPHSGMTVGCGLLGATGNSVREAEENRLLEIERRILAIEAALQSKQSDEQRSDQ